MLLRLVLIFMAGGFAQILPPNATLRVGLLPGTREAGKPYVWTTDEGVLTGYFVDYFEHACTNCSIDWVTLVAGTDFPSDTRPGLGPVVALANGVVDGLVVDVRAQTH